LKGYKIEGQKSNTHYRPSRSGKTSLAERIAKNENWIHVSEDVRWVEIKKGHPAGELRNPEEQRVVQPAVVLQIRDLLSKGNSVVLEFINYENSPKPLIYYYEELGKAQCNILFNRLVRAPTLAGLGEHGRGPSTSGYLVKIARGSRHGPYCRYFMGQFDS
jgi:hypothetical protein